MTLPTFEEQELVERILVVVVVGGVVDDDGMGEGDGSS